MVEDLPSSFTGPTYDAYVYFDSDQVSPNEADNDIYSWRDDARQVKNCPRTLTETFIESIDGGVGNYVVFRDLSDPTFMLTADSDAGRAAITGIQITTEPEPDPIENHRIE